MFLSIILLVQWRSVALSVFVLMWEQTLILVFNFTTINIYFFLKKNNKQRNSFVAIVQYGHLLLLLVFSFDHPILDGLLHLN